MTEHEFWKSIGLCTECHKVKPIKGETLCVSCRERARSYKTKYEKKLKIKREMMRKGRTCYQCGELLNGRKGLCDKCYKEVVIPDYIRSKKNATEERLPRLY